jgi:isoleucyl-tRNA synthetase
MLSMDYKGTLNLPRTDFAMKADLVKREPARLASWETVRLYDRIQAARAGAPAFILHDGPPFANGEIHLGHVLNKILKDIVLRFRSLAGFRAPYVPGWDCHGLPIEFKVTQELRKQRKSEAGAFGSPDTTPAASSAALAAPGAAAELDSPAAVRNACEAYARRYVAVQRDQFKRLSILGDWDNPYLTLAKEYEAEELRLFARLVERGFVYRGKKPVYWSIPCRTALAEAEVEYQEHLSQSVYVKFPVVGHENTFLLIWTTTPWTLPANLAVAYHSHFSYSLVRVATGDATFEDYIVSTLLLPAVAEKCRWPSYQIVRSLDAGHLSQVEFQHPFCARTGRLFPGDDFVTNDTGTGFVHIAPGHGLEDYALGLRQGLPIYSPVDDDGRFAYTDDLPRDQQMPAGMLGRSILERHGKSDANEAVLHELRARAALLHQENYHHSYPHCWRSKTPVIFRAMDQWFVRIDHVVAPTDAGCRMPDAGCPTTERGVPIPGAGPEPRPPLTFRQLALDAIGQVTWIPAWGINRIQGAVQARPDWCISRQRSWGVPLPAFYDASGGAILDARVVRQVAALVEQHGSNVWFEKTASELWALVRPPGWTGPEAAAKSGDTLDVWIDSGSSSQAVTARRPELQRREGEGAGPLQANPHGPAPPFQADLYLEGSDQHRGWFQSSLLLSLAGHGAPPFRTVLTHGFVVGDSGEKESKSRGSKSASLWVNDFGADVLRLWVASQDYRGDMVLSEARMLKVAEAYRLLRNTLRYQLSNLYDFDAVRDRVPEARLTPLDRWILDEFSRLEAAVWEAYEVCEFHQVYQRLSQFAAVELSAVYHDVIKDRLYTDPASSARRRSTQTVLHQLCTGLCQMLSPILVFTADEAWEFLRGRPTESVHLSRWQPRPFALAEAERAEWNDLFALRDAVLPELEKARQAKLIGKALEAKVRLTGGDPRLANLGSSGRTVLTELLNVSGFEVGPAAGPGETLHIEVAKADGQKCERCWHWETSVGASVAHPTLCARCETAVQTVTS